MKIEKGMNVYIKDESMKESESFIKKNGPYEVKDVFRILGIEMASLIVKDSSFVVANNNGIISMPTSELYTKDTDDFVAVNLEDLCKDADLIKFCSKNKYVYKSSNGKTVISEEKLYIGENVLVSDDKTSKHYIVSIATSEIKLNNKKPDYTFVMSMDAMALDEVLEWKIFSDNKKTKEKVKKELNINTLKDLNEYKFITYTTLESILVDELIELIGQSVVTSIFKSMDLTESTKRLANKMGYTNVPNITWLYYKREEQMPKRTSAARIIPQTNKTE